MIDRYVTILLNCHLLIFIVAFLLLVRSKVKFYAKNFCLLPIQKIIEESFLSKRLRSELINTTPFCSQWMQISSATLLPLIFHIPFATFAFFYFRRRFHPPSPLVSLIFMHPLTNDKISPTNTSSPFFQDNQRLCTKIWNLNLHVVVCPHPARSRRHAADEDAGKMSRNFFQRLRGSNPPPQLHQSSTKYCRRELEVALFFYPYFSNTHTREARIYFHAPSPPASILLARRLKRNNRQKNKNISLYYESVIVIFFSFWPTKGKVYLVSRR